MNLTPLTTSPASYGFTRGCMVTSICPLIEQHLLFWYDRDGGTDTDDGRHWIWKSAEELRRWLETTHRIVVSGPTVARALAALVDSGRWVRQQLGQMRRSFYYRPADQCIDQLREMHSSMATNPAETSSEKSSPDGRCAVSEPSEPRTRPVKRGDRPDPTHYQSQAARTYVAPDWAREHVQSTYDLLQPQEAPEQPVTDESPTDPVEQPLQLDSRPAESFPVEPDNGIVTDQGSAAACDALNRAKGRGWVWVAGAQQFRHRVLPMRRTVAEMARALQVAPEALQLVVIGHD